MAYNDEETFKTVRYGTVTVLIGLGLLIALIMGCIWGFKAFGRYQSVLDAENKVKKTKISIENARVRANNEVQLTEIQIRNQQQRVKVAEQKAEIRLKDAQGLRAAQDEVAKTLTPLYVQLEMVNTLSEIAKSGKNNTVIYIPVGPDGLPVVADTSKAGR